VVWLWVKGHAGDPGNERADALANQGMREALSGR
jgi:ribonuclease HI